MEKKRTASIELARIVACLMVLVIHTVTWYTNKEGLLEGSLLIRCFVLDGVPIFWYIMGYFLFVNPNSSQLRRLKKTFTSLILPAVTVMVFCQIWQDWLTADIGGVGFLSCLDMHSLDVHNLVSNLLQWNSGMTFGGHFWYVFSYLQVILWVPLLQFVCVDEPRANKCRHYLLLLAVIYVINRDVSNIGILTIAEKKYPVTVYSVITPTLLYVLLGYEVYLHRADIMKNRQNIRWLGMAGFFLFNILRFFLAVRDMRVDSSKSYFLGIGTCCGYLASLSLFLSLLCWEFRENSLGEKITLFLGSKTLGIYLIHGCVYRKLQAIGVRSFVYQWYTQNLGNLIIEICATIAYALIVFAVCCLLVCMLKQAGVFLKKTVKSFL